MRYLVYPTIIECVDPEIKVEVFTVKAFDECAAEVKIDALVGVTQWDEIAPLIRQALVDLKLEGGVK